MSLTFHAAIMSDCDHLKVELKEKALIEAASEWHEECVQYLIEAGARINIYTDDGVFHNHIKLAMLALLPTLCSHTFPVFFFICNKCCQQM